MRLPWGYQDHPKDWKVGNQAGGTPRWIQFNNNGRAISEPARVPAIEMVDAKKVYDLVLGGAGCWPRDRVTMRIVEEVKNQSGAWGRNAPLELSDDWYLEGLTPGKIPTDTDNDGIPDDWEKVHGLNPRDTADANTVVPAGSSKNNRHQRYTFIEFYLNELADQVNHKS